MLSSIRAQIEDVKFTLSSLFDLVALLLRLGGSDTAIDGRFITDTEQVHTEKPCIDNRDYRPETYHFSPQENAFRGPRT